MHGKVVRRMVGAVAGLALVTAACSSKDSGKGAAGGGGASGAAGAASGSAADCAPGCAKLYKCGYQVQDNNGQPMDEAGCTSGCQSDPSVQSGAACVLKAADCNAVGICANGTPDGG
jgi:hypothetical protein